MRNFLLFLTLCALTLTTSSVFAESYDESKRTERFGLSFYDGAPMYLLYFRRPNPLPPGSSFYEPIPGATMQVERLRSGERIEERDGYNVALGIVADKDSGSTATFISYAYDDAGNLVPMESGSTISNTAWIQSLFREQGPGALTMARLGGGDLAVETYDNILPNAQDWARRGILLAVALLVLSAGSNKFRELTSGGSNVSSQDAKKSDGAASPKAEKPKPKKKIDTTEYLELEHESPYRLRTPRELREERAQEDREHTERQRVMTEEEALREAYISGDYWGKSFSDEVRKSNRELYEAFDKMDPFTRRLLIQKFDEMSFTKEATLLKSYNKDVYGFADDNIGNPFEGEDEEDGEPPF